EQWADLESDRSDPEDDSFFSHIFHGMSGPAHTEGSADDSDEPMLGAAPAFLRAQQMLQRVAPTAATVLLSGESGVGKEMFAQYLHRHSPRRDRPLISLNCASLPENLVEAELFGVERGAF